MDTCKIHLLLPSWTSTCPRYLTKNVLEKLICCRPEWDVPTVNLSGCRGEGRLVALGDVRASPPPPPPATAFSVPAVSSGLGAVFLKKMGDFFCGVAVEDGGVAREEGGVLVTAVILEILGRGDIFSFLGSISLLTHERIFSLSILTWFKTIHVHMVIT